MQDYRGAIRHKKAVIQQYQPPAGSIESLLHSPMPVATAFAELVKYIVRNVVAEDVLPPGYDDFHTEYRTERRAIIREEFQSFDMSRLPPLLTTMIQRIIDDGYMNANELPPILVQMAFLRETMQPSPLTFVTYLVTSTEFQYEYYGRMLSCVGYHVHN